MIWVLGLDLHHFYFALALWADNVPSIKEVPKNIVFYQLKPAHLEPRRPELETNDTVSNVSIDSEDENPKMIEELQDESCEFGKPSSDKQSVWKSDKQSVRKSEKQPVWKSEKHPVWKSEKQSVWKSEKQPVLKGKQGRKGAKKTEHCKEECNTRKVEDEKETFEDEKTCKKEKTCEDEEKTRENENNFSYIFKKLPVPDLPPVSD